MGGMDTIITPALGNSDDPLTKAANELIASLSEEGKQVLIAGGYCCKNDTERTAQAILRDQAYFKSLAERERRRREEQEAEIERNRRELADARRALDSIPPRQFLKPGDDVDAFLKSLESRRDKFRNVDSSFRNARNSPADDLRAEARLLGSEIRTHVRAVESMEILGMDEVSAIIDYLDPLIGGPIPTRGDTSEIERHYGKFKYLRAARDRAAQLKREAAEAKREAEASAGIASRPDNLIESIVKAKTPVGKDLPTVSDAIRLVRPYLRAFYGQLCEHADRKTYLNDAENYLTVVNDPVYQKNKFRSRPRRRLLLGRATGLRS
jgi:hypothetical protein